MRKTFQLLSVICLTHFARCSLGNSGPNSTSVAYEAATSATVESPTSVPVGVPESVARDEEIPPVSVGKRRKGGRPKFAPCRGWGGGGGACPLQGRQVDVLLARLYSHKGQCDYSPEKEKEEGEGTFSLFSLCLVDYIRLGRCPQRRTENASCEGFFQIFDEEAALRKSRLARV